MKAIAVLSLLVLASVASAQTINVTAIEGLLSGYTGGSNGKPSDSYLTTLASTLASGFVSSIGDVVGNITAFVEQPQSYTDLLDSLEADFCTPAYINETEKMPASIIGPEIDLEFLGGACLLNETEFLENGGSLSVDCIAPSVTVQVLPAILTSSYDSAVMFTDKECKLHKTLGESSDNVVFVLDQGVFNISGLVGNLEAGLTSVLGGFSGLAGSVVSAPGLSPILDAVNAATNFLG